MKDWRGTPIKVGSTIIYASHMGPRSWVTEAVVHRIAVGELIVAPLRSTRTEQPREGARVRLKAVERVTVVS